MAALIRLLLKLVADVSVRAFSEWLRDRRLQALGWEKAQTKIYQEREYYAQESQRIRDIVYRLNATELHDDQYFPDPDARKN